MFSRNVSLIASLLLCLQVNCMTQKQHELLNHVKEQLAGQSGLTNSTEFNTTNPLYTGTSDIPAEHVTLPLDHFGSNSSKLTMPLS